MIERQFQHRLLDETHLGRDTVHDGQFFRQAKPQPHVMGRPCIGAILKVRHQHHGQCGMIRHHRLQNIHHLTEALCIGAVHHDDEAINI